MQLQPQQLATHLKKALAPIYVLYGDETLLCQEARDAIRAAAGQQGYQQYQRFDVSTGFNWPALVFECNSTSLFSDKTFIEVRNPQTKFDKTAGATLVDYCKNPAKDKLLLIVCGKLSAAQQKSRWMQAVKQHGVIIPIRPIYNNELPRWIQQRMQQADLKPTTDSVRLLAELTEGNLLACQQAIEKLRLLYPQQQINPEHIGDVANNSARFNVFALGDYILAGNARRVITVIDNLKAEGSETTLVLWLLTRELRILIDMLQRCQQGQSTQQVVASQWPQRQALYKATLRRLNLNQAKQLLQQAHLTDRMIKGITRGDVWLQLSQLCLAIAGQNPFPNVSHQ